MKINIILEKQKEKENRLIEYVKLFEDEFFPKEVKINEREGTFAGDFSDSVKTLSNVPVFNPFGLKKEPGSTTSFKDSPPSSMKPDKDDKPAKDKNTKDKDAGKDAEDKGRVETSCFSKKGHNLTFQEAAYLVLGHAKDNNLIDYPTMDIDYKNQLTGAACTSEFIETIQAVQRDLGLEDDGVIGKNTISAIEEKKRESEDKPSTTTVATAPTSTADAGETISIIGKRGRTHGAAGGFKNVIPGIINSVNVHETMLASGQFILGRARPDTAWGNPVLAQVMIAAAEYAQKFKNPDNDNSGKIDLGNVGYKYGGPIETSTSHQVGLDVDCSFYRNDGTTRWFFADQDFKSFDVDRNVAFMHYLVTAANPRLSQCFVSNETWRLLTKAVENSREEIKNMFKLLQSKRTSFGGVNHYKNHNDHYHIRLQHPKNSKTLVQLEKEIGQEEFDKLVKQSLSNSLVNINPAKKEKLKIIKQDKKYSKYYDGDIADFLKDRPGVTNTAKKYNVNMDSWKNTIDDLAPVLKVRPEDINKLTKSRVIRLQNTLGIENDGIVGGDTLAALSYVSDARDKKLLEEDKKPTLEKIDLEGFKNSREYKKRESKISKLVNNKLGIKGEKPTSDSKSNLIIDLLKQTGPSRFGYVVGTIDGKILASHNKDKLFYGASSNKTMAGLVQLIKFESDKEKQLDDGELRGLLTYASRIPPYTGANSNRVNRSLTGIGKFSYEDKTGKTKTKHPHYRTGDRPKIGVIDGPDVKKVAKIFDINNGMFRWGGVRNKQTPLDQFKLFAGLARIDTGNFKDKEEEQYYNEHKESFDRIIKITKERTTTQYKGGKGWLQNTGIYRSGTEGVWMKGGQAAGACNIAFVFEGKYVISVYSRYINKGITENSPGPFAGNTKHFNREGWLRDLDIVSKTTEELMSKHVFKTSSLEEIIRKTIKIIIEKKNK